MAAREQKMFGEWVAAGKQKGSEEQLSDSKKCLKSIATTKEQIWSKGKTIAGEKKCAASAREHIQCWLSREKKMLRECGDCQKAKVLDGCRGCSRAKMLERHSQCQKA